MTMRMRRKSIRLSLWSNLDKVVGLYFQQHECVILIRFMQLLSNISSSPDNELFYCFIQFLAHPVLPCDVLVLKTIKNSIPDRSC